MDVRKLKLSIISAQDLKKVSTFGHDRCYAVVYIYSSETKSTGVDNDGGENPYWNAKFTLHCEDELLRQGRSYITVDIYSYGSFSNKIVGTAMIPLMDVGKQEVGKTQFLTYEVYRPSGKVRGLLNVSLKVGEKQTVDVLNRTAPSVQAYAPPRWSSQEGNGAADPPQTTSYNHAVADNGASVYPPPKPQSDSSATSISDSKKEEEPVLAYPAYGLPGAYSHNQYGWQYGPQGYYYPPRPSYSYQEQYIYSKPLKYQGSSSSSGSGLGLLGGVLGGLLLGDLIGNIF